MNLLRPEFQLIPSRCRTVSPEILPILGRADSSHPNEQEMRNDARLGVN
jgi:hypothetical protein